MCRRPATLLKMRLLRRGFSVNFAKNTIFTESFLATASHNLCFGEFSRPVHEKVMLGIY